MRKPNMPFLVLSLALCSGIILVDRFATPLPNWLALPLALVAAVSLIIAMVKSRQVAR